MWKWKHFGPEEVLSPTGAVQYGKGNLLLQTFALDAIDGFRDVHRFPMMVNHKGLTLRGYRSPAENSKAGGEHLSRHIQGIAFDITPRDIDLYAFYELVLHSANEFGFGGIGYYPKKNFLHIDCRPLLADGPITWIEK